MTIDAIQFRIEDLPKADMLDIEARAVAEAVRREPVEVAPGSSGEPITFGLVLLGAIALKAYVAHVTYKMQALPTEELTQKVTVMRDGEGVEVRELTFKARSGEKPSDAVMRELATVPGLEGVMRQLAP